MDLAKWNRPVVEVSHRRVRGTSFPIDRLNLFCSIQRLGTAISPRGDMPKNRVRLFTRTPHVCLSFHISC